MKTLSLIVDGELMKGDDVRLLQQALTDKGFPCGKIDGIFGVGTEAAVCAFQGSVGDLLVDGEAGPRTLTRLGLSAETSLPSVLGAVDTGVVARILTGARITNIEANLPPLLDGLKHFGLTDKKMVLMALATIAAETAGFRPIDEGISRFNTSPRGHPFDLYDNRTDLGNRGAPDGASFKGRGYIQLTGRHNYREIGKQIGVDLEGNPDLANDPQTAGLILACFLKNHEVRIKTALLARDFRRARRAVNGGSHGLDAFTEAYKRGEPLL